MGRSKEEFDAVVVGSGFGGSVMTYRLGMAGLKVCLLERGRKFPPGSFPRSPYKMRKNFWDPSKGLYGLFNIWSFDNLGAIVSSGLGGGSLIYANVLIRKPKEWFEDTDPVSGERRPWPVQREELDPHYDRVEKMLGAQKYPFTREPYSNTPKSIELQAAAEQLGYEHYFPKLAVSFAGEGRVPGEPIEDADNMHEVPRYTCRLVGECDIGCNFGSKNTLDLTYLSKAEKLPNVEIRCLSEVRSFSPRGGGADDSGGYTVEFVEHSLGNEGEQFDTHDTGALPPQTILTKRLILSAGTLGSTFLLLKMQKENREAFDKLDRLPLGERFGGNGDFLMLATGAKRRSDGKEEPRILDPSNGPVITSTVHIPDSESGGLGHYVQDGGYPDFVSWNIGATNLLYRAARFLRFTWNWLDRDPETDMSAKAARLFGRGDFSARVLPFLGMGRDVPDGRMELREGKLNVDWKSTKSRPYFRAVRSTMRRLARKLDARMWDIPLWYLSRFVTVHPLGGCPMGGDDGEGVVDSYGKVVGYEHLYVADGSVMPGPIGPNPSLTIAALAERFACRIIEEWHEENE